MVTQTASGGAEKLSFFWEAFTKCRITPLQGNLKEKWREIHKNLLIRFFSHFIIINDIGCEVGIVES